MRLRPVCDSSAACGPGQSKNVLESCKWRNGNKQWQFGWFLRPGICRPGLMRSMGGRVEASAPTRSATLQSRKRKFLTAKIQSQRLNGKHPGSSSSRMAPLGAVVGLEPPILMQARAGSRRSAVGIGRGRCHGAAARPAKRDQAMNPPSTTISVPVIQRASSPAR